MIMCVSLPTAKISNPDVTRLINSTEIQSVVRPAGQKVQKRPWTQKKNPLHNKSVLFRLNPYAKVLRKQELRACISTFLLIHSPDNERVCAVHQERVKAKKEAKKPKVQKAAGEAFLKTLFAP
jgi:large subunit ribosomal protein L4e